MSQSQSQLSILALLTTLYLIVWNLLASATSSGRCISAAAHSGVHLRLDPLDLSHDPSQMVHQGVGEERLSCPSRVAF